MSAWRALAFERSRFGPELFALCRDVPYLDHLLCFIEDTHAPVRGDQEVRNWHRALAQSGSFDIWLRDRTAMLRSGRAVMLEDKTAFFGVQGRPDLLLAASRVGFGQPLTAVVLPRHRIVAQVGGADWGVTAERAERAVALFAAHGPECWADTLLEPRPSPLLVTGDANYAHHIWNQLGAVAALLDGGGAFEIAVTHQPIAPLREVFADRPGLRIHRVTPDTLPTLDPMQMLPFPAGGMVVTAAARERVRRIAERQAAESARRFLGKMQDQGRRPVWLTLRLQRTALNQLGALSELAGALIADGRYAVVLDGYSRPQDFATNPAYDKPAIDRGIARERIFVDALVKAIERRIGAPARDAVLSAVGWDLLDSIFLAGHCAAYFANHGTLQHKIGYFTKVPGLVHANPAILAINRAATHTHVIEDSGVVEYIDGSLVEDAPAAGGVPLHADNNYRFTDIPRLVAAFLGFVRRYDG
jgi:hypothetical protein